MEVINRVKREIEKFGGKGQVCWLVGAFDVEGELHCLEQFYTEKAAQIAAEDLEKQSFQYDDGSWNENSLFPFIGKLEMTL
jgi:hypothetical protein